MAKLFATPGVCIVEEITTDANSPLQLETKKDKMKLLKGTVLAVGEEGVTKFGARVTAPCATGDIVYFLSYEETGGYDSLRFEGKKYFVVEFLDIRAIVVEENA